jgi:hypothetical protein
VTDGDSESLEESTGRIAALTQVLGALPDQQAAGPALELIQLILRMHGDALARMMTAISADSRSAHLVHRLIEDEGVSGVLLLHDLHPAGFEQRVRAALEHLHAPLGVRGAAIEDIAISGHAVHIRLRASDSGRYRSDGEEAIRREIEHAIVKAAPDTAGIEVEHVPQSIAVPVSSIRVRHRTSDNVSPLA